MHDKLHDMASKIADYACAKIEATGLHEINSEELGEITDILKDLNEAEYYAHICHDMREENERMGYDNYRYASGRFAPKGRGTYYGYMEPIHAENERMGYPMPHETTAYQEYRDRRRNYTENKTAENRQMMEQSAQDHLRETMQNVREIWAEVDEPMRMKIKQDLTSLVNELK